MTATPTDAANHAALEAALDALFGAPFGEFVAERKRLVGELRKAGHRAAATALGQVNRPTLSCWTINQLVRKDVSELDALFSAAHRVRLGDFSATADHRALLARLHTRALELLRAAELPTSDATLRRIATTLSALSAYGGFSPDVPGRMIEDRDPPGFDAMDLVAHAASTPRSYLSVVRTAGPEAPHAAAAPEPLPAAPAPLRAAPEPLRAAADAGPVHAAPAAAEPRAAPSATEPPKPTRPHLSLVPATGPAGATGAAGAAGATGASPRPAAVVEERVAPGAEPIEDAAASADAAAAAAEAAAAEAAAAEAAAAEAAAQLAAAQAAALAAAERVRRARQRSQLEALRIRQKRLSSAIHDHEQAIALIQKELESRQRQLAAARAEVAPLAAELATLEAALGPEEER